MFPSLAWFVFYCIIGIVKSVSGYVAVITNNGPVVQGAAIQFKVEIFDDESRPLHGNFEYFWKDVKYPEKNATFSSKLPYSYWNLTTSTKYAPGDYLVQLQVQGKRKIFFIPSTTMIINQTETFTVTKYLNGEFVLTQRNYTRRKFIDNTMILNHTVRLNLPDMQYINTTKNSITTFWFIDCIYHGLTSGFSYNFNYSKPETDHSVQALVVATNVPLNITLEETQIGNSSDSKNVSGNEELWNPDKPFKDWLVTYNKTHVKGNLTFNSNTCIDISSIPLNKNYSYGLFSTNFTVKEPVKVSPINGTSWLKAGEILNITMSCTGSPPFKYCKWFRPGLYNVTGKEVCEEETVIKNCSFNIQHLFTRNTEYTVVVFLSNSVSQVIKPIAVNIYKVTKQPQLSVIIVPVVFSIVAVITIIFGVAFYLQSKRSYTIEVADFDFANQSSDMEYKSFRERLRESVSNLFLKSNDFNDEDDDQVWSPTRKYGSMQ